jgi:hypothetical protein
MNAIVSIFIYSAIFIIVFIVATVIFILLKKRSSLEVIKDEENPWPLTINKNFLTASEQSFYNVLKLFAGDKYAVCPKARLCDVVLIQKGTDNGLRQSLFNRISRKHLDFILLDLQTLVPTMAIELDDQSHQSYDVQKRDRVKNKALHDAGLKLVRVPVKHAYTQSDLAEII